MQFLSECGMVLESVLFNLCRKLSQTIDQLIKFCSARDELSSLFWTSSIISFCAVVMSSGALAVPETPKSESLTRSQLLESVACVLFDFISISFGWHVCQMASYNSCRKQKVNIIVGEINIAWKRAMTRSLLWRNWKVLHRLWLTRWARSEKRSKPGLTEIFSNPRGRSWRHR